MNNRREFLRKTSADYIGYHRPLWRRMVRWFSRQTP